MENDEAPEGRRAVDDALLEFLASGWSHEQSAAAAGVSVRTVQRRLRDDEFRRELALRRAARKRRQKAQTRRQRHAGSIGGSPPDGLDGCDSALAFRIAILQLQGNHLTGGTMTKLRPAVLLIVGCFFGTALSSAPRQTWRSSASGCRSRTSSPGSRAISISRPGGS